jgi:gamma-glutamyltranspeptidase/glutathione hydrolase
VVSAHPLASQVGLSILQKGGNAVDAAVATALALAVVHPQAGNLGGGGFMILHLRDGKEMALDFREMAPRRAHKDMYLDKKGRVRKGQSLWTSLAVGVPGSPAGLFRAHESYGVLPWKDLVAPAIRLAKEGFAVDSFLHRSILAKRRFFLRWEATSKIFLPGGKPLALGARLVQADLAKTLERLAAKGGIDGFYRGETAKKIEAWMEESDGLIDRKDLAAYRVVRRKPLRGSYRGYPVLSMPPPSSGGVALVQMLGLLEKKNLRAMGFGSASSLHWMIEAMRRAYADRARWLGDPDFYPVPVKALISPKYLDSLAGGMNENKATPEVLAGNPKAFLKESRETTHFSVLDAKGNAVSCTTTLNSSFGNCQVVPGLGFFLNNEMDDFSAKPGVPNQFGLVGAEANAIAAKKRMLSSMTPTIVLDRKGEKPFLVLGSPGGGRIINTVLQVVVNVVDHHLPLHLAVGAPRIHQQWKPRETAWERLALVPEVRKALMKKGQIFAKRPRTIGRCQAILWRSDGKMFAAADPRSNGSAVAW